MENENLEIIEYEATNIATTEDREMEEDIEEVRETYKTLITKGKEGLKTAERIVEGSEHPRAIEVFSGLLNTIASINSKLLELHKTKKEIKNPAKSDSPQAITNNNVWIGSPADLQRLLDA